MICPHCHQETSSLTRFCQNCQQDMEPQIVSTLRPTGSWDDPDGIGGWLVVVLIGLIVSALSFLYQYAINLLPAIDGVIWGVLTNPLNPGYNSSFASVIFLAVGESVLLFICDCVLIFLLLTRNHRFPRLYIAFVVLNLGLALVDLWTTRKVLEAAQISTISDQVDMGRALVSCAIWIPYMLRSERVKKTFARRSRDQNPAE